MSELAVLRAAWRLIEEPCHWSARGLAQDRQGRRVLADDPAACRWCAIGALERVCLATAAVPAVHRAAVARLGDAAEALAGTRALCWLNDWGGHGLVRRIYQQAIAQAAAAAIRPEDELARLRRTLAEQAARIGQLERQLASPAAIVRQPPLQEADLIRPSFAQELVTDAAA